MASKYARNFEIPAGFPELLKDFTREVLRAQPQNIYAFAAQFFENRKTDGFSSNAADVHDEDTMSRADIEQLVKELFVEADADRSGYLDRKEFKKLFQRLSKDLALKPSDVWRFMAEADENNDGQIDYHEFVPIATEIVQSIFAKMKLQKQKAEKRAQAQMRAEEILLHGLPSDELELVLQNVFKSADKDNSGFLSREEFRECMNNADLGFTRKEINILLSEIDENQDGLISYEEFIPICLEVLTRILADDILEFPTNSDDLTQFLLDLFRSGDAEESGYLSANHTRSLLRGADLGLTRLQICTILSEAELTEDNAINYVSFARTAAQMISNMIDFDAMTARAQNLRQNSAEALNGLTREQIETHLSTAFEAADQLGAGILDQPTVQQIIAEVAQTYGFGARQQRLLLHIADMDQAQMIQYHSIVESAYDSLKYLEREENQ
eukprot:GILJ01000724.1.p1 GENE.GILJ01000724.1~~GILJ01000724.1.p1  ORF type:complete len:441 (+),score=78.51 GILJ01000724.1:39-1361(+)